MNYKNHLNYLFESIIKYINSYFDHNREFYQKLSVFDCHSKNFLKWSGLMDVVNLIKINDLNTDELYNEYCEIKFMYDDMKNKIVKVNEQIKSYSSSKNVYNPTSTISHDEVQRDINNDKENSSVYNDTSTNLYIDSDQLWSFLLNIKLNTTPNIKLIVAYVFYIPCSNAFVETIFSHMHQL